MPNQNPFIVIEGIDASGKASVAKFIAESLSAELFAFPQYKNTSGQVVLSNLQQLWRPSVDAGLFMAANARDASEDAAAAYLAVARPHGMPLGAVVRQALQTANRCEAHGALTAALARGKVVADRYTLSGFVYGVAEGLTPEYIRNLSAPLLVPDLTIVLDIPAELVSERRPQARDANELNLPLLRATRKGYRAAAGLWLEEATAPKIGEPWEARDVPGFGTVTIVDATQPLDDVRQQVLAIVLQHLAARAQRVCLRVREGAYTPRCRSATPAPFVTGRRDLVTCQQCLAPPYFPDESAHSGPPFNQVVHGETYEEHVKRLAEAIGANLQVNVTVSGAPDADALRTSIETAFHEIISSCSTPR